MEYLMTNVTSNETSNVTLERCKSGFHANGTGNIEHYWEGDIAEMIFLIILAIFGITGNALVLIVYPANSKKQASIFFIRNLAMIDLVTCAVPLQFSIYATGLVFRLLDYHGAVYGAKKYCPEYVPLYWIIVGVEVYLNFAILASFMNLLGIAWDVHQAVAKPYERRVRNKRPACILYISYVILFGFSIPFRFDEEDEFKFSPVLVDGNGTEDQRSYTVVRAIFDAILGLSIILLFCSYSITAWRLKRLADDRKNKYSRGCTNSFASTQQTDVTLELQCVHKDGDGVGGGGGGGGSFGGGDADGNIASATIVSNDEIVVKIDSASASASKSMDSSQTKIISAVSTMTSKAVGTTSFDGRKYTSHCSNGLSKSVGASSKMPPSMPPSSPPPNPPLQLLPEDVETLNSGILVDGDLIRKEEEEAKLSSNHEINSGFVDESIEELRRNAEEFNGNNHRNYSSTPIRDSAPPLNTPTSRIRVQSEPILKKLTNSFNGSNTISWSESLKPTSTSISIMRKRSRSTFLLANISMQKQIFYVGLFVTLFALISYIPAMAIQHWSIPSLRSYPILRRIYYIQFVINPIIYSLTKTNFRRDAKNHIKRILRGEFGRKARARALMRDRAVTVSGL